MEAIEFIRAMSPPAFFLLYATAVVVGVVASGRYAVRRADRTDTLPQLPVSPAPDPYEVAYLRGGKAEVARLAVLALMQVGSLEVREEFEYHWYGDQLVPKVGQSPGQVRPGGEPWFLPTVHGWFSPPQPRDQVYDVWLKDLEGVYAGFDGRFRSRSLVTPREVTSTAWLCWLVATLVFVVPAFSSAAGANLGLFLWPATSVIIGIACCPGPHSKRGEAYLRQLQLAYATLPRPLLGVTASGGGVAAGTQSISSPSGVGSTSDQRQGQADHALLLSVGLFGSGALSGTSFGFLQGMFEPCGE